MTEGELILSRVGEIKRIGNGSVTVKIQDHKVVYVERTAGEQISNEQRVAIIQL